MIPHFAGEPLEAPEGYLQVPCSRSESPCCNSPNEGTQTQTPGV